MAKIPEHYSDQETKKRFEEALRGARIAGHRPQSQSNLGKSKVGQKNKLAKHTKKPAG